MSALIGQPPANHDDYLVVRAWYVTIGLADKINPAKGFHFGVSRPPPDQYHRETRAPIIYGYCSVAIFLMIMATAVRVAIRVRNYKLHVGWDDWVIVLATVSRLHAVSMAIG